MYLLDLPYVKGNSVDDAIFLKGIQISVFLGVSASERSVQRPVTLDIEITRNLERPGQSDHIGDTIDYGEVFDLVSQVASAREYCLVEALAERIATVLLDTFSIHSVTVVVRKPRPIIGLLDHAGVRIIRSRTGKFDEIHGDKIS